MLQSWLRHGSHLQGYWETSAANFKQCCGLCTDLVVEYIVQFASEYNQIHSFSNFLLPATEKEVIYLALPKKEKCAGFNANFLLVICLRFS